MATAGTKEKSTRRTRAAKMTAQKKSVTSPKLAAPTATPAKKTVHKFPNSWQLLQRTVLFWRHHAKPLAIYMLVILGLNLLLVHNFSTSAAPFQTQLTQFFSAAQGNVAVYQYILFIIVSLSMIWLLRQLLSDQPPQELRVRDAFYLGMYPLIPFVLVLLVLTLTLIPLFIGLYLYTVVVQGGIAVGAVQNVIWLAVLLLGAAISCWLFMTYFFAIYIVTLPNMTPVRALRSAKQLSRGRRPNILRKALILLLVVLLTSTILLLPVLGILPKLVGLWLFILSVAALPFIHSYQYALYRELLDE